MLNDVYARFGIKVDKGSFSAAEGAVKKLTEAVKVIQNATKVATSETKANIAAIKEQIASSKLAEQQTKAETSEIRRQTAEFNLNTKMQRENERQERQSLKQRSESWNSFARSARNAILGITAGLYGLTRLTRGTRETSLEYRDFARQTGLSISRLQSYQAAAAETGSRLTSSQVTQDITSLQQKLVDVEFGQGNVFPYKMLGISAATKDAMAVIEGLRNSIRGLDDTRALNLIRRIGLSDDWLHLLRQSREEFEKIQKVMLSREQLSNTTTLAMNFRRFAFAVSNLKDQFVAFISNNFSIFIRNLKDMAMDLSAFLKDMYNSPEAFRRFAAGIAVIVTALSPLTAALAAAYLILEDMYVASKGGISLFNWDMDAWDIFIKTLKTVADLLTTIFNLMVGLGKAPSNWEKSFTAAFTGRKSNEGMSWSEILFNPGSWVQTLEDAMTRGLQKRNPLGLGNTNNITVNVRTPEEGGRFVTEYVGNQQSEMNTTFAESASR